MQIGGEIDRSRPFLLGVGDVGREIHRLPDEAMHSMRFADAAQAVPILTKMGT